VPDWLAELQLAGAEEPTESAPAVEEGDGPDWLAELQPTGAEEPAESAPAVEEDDGPDWLAELQPTGAEEPEPTVTERAAEEGDAPDWLAELQPAVPDEETEPSEADAAAAEEIPDWLTELQPSVTTEEASTEDDAEAGDVPDWLAGLQSTPPGDEPAFETSDKDSTGSALSAALAGVGLAALAREPKDLQTEATDVPAEIVPSDLAPTEGQVETQAMPDWLAEVGAATGVETGQAEDAMAETELPDWLVPTEAGLTEDESLERAEIPTWLLSLKPQELREDDEEEGEPPAPEPDGAVEETGLLAGIPGILPVEMLIAQPRAADVPEVEIARPTDSAQSRLFAEIVARPPTVAPKVIAQLGPDALAKLPRLIIYLALILAVTLPLVLGESLIPRTIEANDGLMGLYDTIQELPAGARVLVAFDYDPATSGEMDVIAQSIVGHLAEQKAQLAAVSLLPAGPATAQSLLEETAVSGQYVNLGYLPGQATAVRLMSRSMALAVPHDYQGRPLSELGIMDGISSLSDFDLIIELAATQESLRWWIEQRDQSNNNPMAAGVSASVEPLALPYYETTPRQLTGLVGGVAGAAMYESQYRGLDSLPKTLAARLDAQLAGHIVLILVLLVGNVVYLFRRRTGEEQ